MFELLDKFRIGNRKPVYGSTIEDLNSKNSLGKKIGNFISGTLIVSGIGVGILSYDYLTPKYIESMSPTLSSINCFEYMVMPNICYKIDYTPREEPYSRSIDTIINHHIKNEVGMVLPQSLDAETHYLISSPNSRISSKFRDIMVNVNKFSNPERGDYNIIKKIEQTNSIIPQESTLNVANLQ